MREGRAQDRGKAGAPRVDLAGDQREQVGRLRERILPHRKVTPAVERALHDRVNILDPALARSFEIGIAVPYPAVSIERDFSYTKHHPVAEAYYLYEPPPHNRPTWDLTSALYAVLPDRGYFELSPPGKVTLGPDGFTGFKPEENGRDRFLILPPKMFGVNWLKLRSFRTRSSNTRRTTSNASDLDTSKHGFRRSSTILHFLKSGRRPLGSQN